MSDEKCPWCGAIIGFTPGLDRKDEPHDRWFCPNPECDATGPWRPTREEAVGTMGDVIHPSPSGSPQDLKDHVLATILREKYPRVHKQIVRNRPFFLVRMDEPYAPKVAGLIKSHEGSKWTYEDETLATEGMGAPPDCEPSGSGCEVCRERGMADRPMVICRCCHDFVDNERQSAERERDEARAELAELREALDEAALCETEWVWGNGMVEVEAHGNGPGPKVGAAAVLAWYRERKMAR